MLAITIALYNMYIIRFLYYKYYVQRTEALDRQYIITIAACNHIIY